jgi:hypothetical protein
LDIVKSVNKNRLLNIRTEDQWLHLKRQELASRVFDDEYDLVLAIIEGLENRGQQGDFSVERLMFN